MAKRTKKKRSNFKGKVSRNVQEQKSRRQSFGHLKLKKGIELFKEKGGSRVRLDIIPYEVTDARHPDRDEEYGIAVPGELWYKRPYWLHRNIGPNNDSTPCPKSIGKKCPICEYRAKLLKDGADWKDESVKALKPSMRNLYAVIPKNNKEYESKPYVWDISQFLFEDKLAEEIEEDERNEEFPDLENGLTLKIRFSEESFGGNSYAETSRIDFIERKEQYDESILKEIPNLDELIEVPSYSALEAMFFGGLDQDEAEDDEDQDEDEEDEVAEEIIEEEEEEEEEEDEEEEDEEEEDEEEEDDIPEGMIECVACEGSGKNTKGNRCSICKGKGYVPEPDNDDDFDEDEEEEDEEEEEEKKPVKSNKGKKSSTASSKKKDKKSSTATGSKKGTKKTKKDKCPYGHTFGVDCEEYDECDDCELWEECYDAKEEG